MDDYEVIALTARQHHYVSQCYLKGFVTDRDNPKLFVVDLKDLRSFFTNPSNVAVERDFHRIDIEGHAPDALENAFSGFETELDQALRRIAAARSLEDESDRVVLFNLIGLLAIKNPRLRETFRAAHEQTAKIIMDLVTATPERFATHIKRAQKDGFVAADTKISYEEMHDFAQRGEYRIETETTMHLQMELSTLEKILPLIMARGWMLVKAPVANTGFVTSDQPACLMWSDPAKRGLYPPGLGLRETRLLFPICNEQALIGSFEIEDGAIDADNQLIAQINGSILLHARRQIYARDRDFRYQWRQHEAPVCGDQLLADLAPASPTG